MIRSTPSATVVALSKSVPADVDTDLLIFPVFEGESFAAAVPGISEATGNAVDRALASREVQGKPYELFFTPIVKGWRSARVALIGAGREADFNLERLRRVATAAALAAKQRYVSRLAFVHRTPTDRGLDPRLAVQAITEGLILAAFNADRYKSQNRSGPAAEQSVVVVPPALGRERELEEAVERGRVLGESSNIARELSNEPANVLTPSVFADRGAAIAQAAGLSVEILDEEEIARLHMGLLMGVARGSVEPPRVLVMKHEPAGAPAAPVLGLVGKGITFDTGGISIKPAEGMDRMKDDMAGGAAVVCAMRAIALLEAPITVVGIVPMAENMPGGRAVKPGDVLTGAGGKTVEVLNTDAEGRLILADGLWYAQRLGATHLVDVATLTGACVVALGKAASGLFGQPESWVETIRAVGARAGDRAWPMPLYEEYGEQLRSEIADLVNTGGRPAGACTAAMFLKEFSGNLPWAHLDVAGTAWAEDAKPWQPKGATGVAVRTLAELAFTSAEWT
jgi:leucyl aminopeptidase